MPLLKGALVLALAAVLAGALAACGRRTGRRWPVTEALLLGPDPQDEGLDLRFAAVAAALALLVLTAVGFRDAFRAMAAGELVFYLLLGLPVSAGALAALGDLAGRLLPRRPREGAAATPAPVVRDLLEEAREEVDLARHTVTDPTLLAALEALDEAVADYGHGLLEARDEEELEELRSRLDGVMALTRSCLTQPDEGWGEAPELDDAVTDAEVHEVCAALAQLDRG